jgi:hypothetical protein
MLGRRMAISSIPVLHRSSSRELVLDVNQIVNFFERQTYILGIELTTHSPPGSRRPDKPGFRETKQLFGKSLNNE